jgi:hypothetical protein
VSKIYKTVKGKSVDIDKVKLANESAIAVSNMRVNARGDALGPGGQVTEGRNQVMDRVYAVESAPEPPYSPNNPEKFAELQAIQNASSTKKLHDLANNLIPAGNQEPLVNPDQPAPARGSLASSVAKTVVVNQTAAPTPQEQRRAQGPKRI